MRVAILTVPFNNNYGGYLQAYALMTVLKQLGHEPTLVMRRHNSSPVSIVFKLKFFVKGALKTILHRKWHPCFYNVEDSFWHKGKAMMPFLNNNIAPQTKYLYSTESLRKVCEEKFDAYIVGSDQVWRAIYVPTIIGNMYLDFTYGWNVKRISYAASFGTNAPEYTNEEKTLCGKLIENFDAVSVRETGGLNVIKDFGWSVKNPHVVLDPTLLLSMDDYTKLVPQANTRSKEHIFCYVLDKSEEAQSAIVNIQKVLDKPIYEIADIQKGGALLPSVEEWLSAIRDADFVITDSFHGTVFSIIFNKPFAVYVNRTRGANRFESLLGSLDLSNHILTKDTNILELTTINWNQVNTAKKEATTSSIEFLINSLS